MASRGLPRSNFRSRAAPAADRSPGAAVLGSRSGRRQMQTVLDVARATGAYSVSFKMQRGAVAGFTIYMANGSYMHAGPSDEDEPTHAAEGAGPVHDAARGDAPRERAPAEPPGTVQRCRWRGCRSGRRHRRHSGSDSEAADSTAAPRPAPQGDDAQTTARAVASRAASEPGRHTTPLTQAAVEDLAPPARRVPCAPTVDYRSDFTVSSTPEGASPISPRMSASSASSGGGEEREQDPFPLCISYEERRYEYYRTRRGRAQAAPSRKRHDPPSPAAGSPHGGRDICPPTSHTTQRSPRAPA